MTSPCTAASTGNESNLESAMQLMIQTFHKYSGNEGDKYTLSRGELKEMLTEELGNYLGNAQDKDAVDKVMGDLDANNDGEVDFTEFIILVGALTVACNDFFLEYNKDDKKCEKKCEKNTISPCTSASTDNESNLENAMQLMIQTFHKYSGKEGDKYTLSRGELKVMLTEELGNYLGNAEDQDAVDKMMGNLDTNNDGEVDFTEFVILVGALTVARNDFFLDYNKDDNKQLP